MRLRPTDVYFFYDASGALLYVGVSKCARIRKGQHQYRSRTWFSKALRMEVVNFPNRQAALGHEAHAIRTRKPLFNIVMNEFRWPWDE